jgi:long-chain acyl-CoA synthetase
MTLMSGLIDSALSWWRSGDSRQVPTTGDRSVVVTTEGVNSPPEKTTAAQDTATESPWLAQLDRLGIPRSLNYPNTSLGKLLDQTADRFGGSLGLTYSGRNWTWTELRDQCNRLAGGLARLGVRRGDRVLMALPNCPEYIFSFFAIQKLGAIVVNAGPLIGPDDLQQILSVSTPKVIIGLDLQAPMLSRISRDSTVEHWVWVSLALYQPVLKRLGYQFKVWHERESQNGNTARHLSMEKLMTDAPARPPTVEPEPDRIAVLQPTSGTTGFVKLVKLSHRNLIDNAVQVSLWLGAHVAQERFFTALPMFHVYGLTAALITPVYLAAPMLVMTRFNAAQALEWAQQFRPTIFPLVPAMCDAISNLLQARSRENGSFTGFADLRMCISGAAPLSQETADRFIKLTGAKLVEGYGLSEAGPVTHVNPPDAERIGSIGLPMPDTQCRIVDLETGQREMPLGECGELLVSGPQIMAGYLANPEQTQKALTTDSHGRTWLHTGDIVWVDPDGYFHVQDRMKDMIIRSGMKVYAAKVERVLRTHPQVADVAVIGVADPIHTEEVVAMVVPANTDPEKQTELAETLRTFCRERLAPYEVPARVQFVKQLPRSALGKLLKRELKSQLETTPAQKE